MHSPSSFERLHLVIWTRNGSILGATLCLVCVYGAGWAQGSTPEAGAGSEVKERAAAPALGVDYLSRVVSATQQPKVGSVVQRTSLVDTIAGLGIGDDAAAHQAWSECTSNMAEVDISTDAESFILYILNRSYLQSNPDLLVRAEKVRFYREQLAAVETHIVGLRKQETAYTAEEVRETTIEEITLAAYVPGGSVVRTAAPERISRGELVTRIASWERSLNLVSDEVHMAESDLERAMEKDATAMASMSWASKMLHDVAREHLDGSD